MKKNICFAGEKFTLEENSGYYSNTKTKERLHRFVWKHHHGEIERNCHIHHIDLDKSNNDISNLVKLTRSEHTKLHAALLTEEQKEKRIKNFIENAVPKAAEWHSSKEGKEWHLKHYEDTKEKMKVANHIVCLQCGEGHVSKGTNGKFCSNKCKSKFRRDNKLDDVIKVCPVCNAIFSSNKYNKTVTCSRSCSNKNRNLRYSPNLQEK